jgi:hypothetical protein
MLNETGHSPVDVSEIANQQGINYPVKITEALRNALMPNEYLAGLGVSFSERLNNILGFLKGSLVPANQSPDETVPEEGIVIYYAITRGPLIRETALSIRAALCGGKEGKQEIVLSLIKDDE